MREREEGKTGRRRWRTVVRPDWSPVTADSGDPPEQRTTVGGVMRGLVAKELEGSEALAVAGSDAARPGPDGLEWASIWVGRADARWEEGGAGRGTWRAATSPRRRQRRVQVVARPLGQRQVAAAG